MPSLHIPARAPSTTRYFKESDVRETRKWNQIIDFITGASAKFGYSNQCTAVDNGDTTFDAKFDFKNRSLIKEKVYVVSEDLDMTVSATAVLVIFEKCVFIRNLCLFSRSRKFRDSFFEDLQGIIRHYSDSPIVTCTLSKKAGLFRALGLKKTRYSSVKEIDPAFYILNMSQKSVILIN